MAKTPESSEFTSIHDRIHAEVPRDAGKQPKAPKKQKVSHGGNNPTRKRAKSQPRHDAWLSPVELAHAQRDCSERLIGLSAPIGAFGVQINQPSVAQEVSHEKNFKPQLRASNRGFLPVSKSEYLRIVDWTGRQIRREKRDAIPADLKPILERLRIVDERWLDTVKHFGRYFRRVAGRVSSLSNEAVKRNRSWLQGIRHSREMFV